MKTSRSLSSILPGKWSISAALRNVSLDDPQGWDEAIAALAADYQPIGDMRASAEYRLASAQALLRKALMEVASGNSTSTRIANARMEFA